MPPPPRTRTKPWFDVTTIPGSEIASVTDLGLQQGRPRSWSAIHRMDSRKTPARQAARTMSRYDAGRRGDRDAHVLTRPPRRIRASSCPWLLFAALPQPGRDGAFPASARTGVTARSLVRHLEQAYRTLCGLNTMLALHQCRACCMLGETSIYCWPSHVILSGFHYHTCPRVAVAATRLRYGESKPPAGGAQWHTGAGKRRSSSTRRDNPTVGEMRP